MAFLIGAFGCFSKSVITRQMSSIAEQYADGQLYSCINNDIAIFAGQKRNQLQSDRIIPLANDSGVFVGRIFDNKTYKNIQSIDQIVHIILSSPEVICKQFWGRYSGALYNKDTRSITLIRDPLGLLTLFYMKVSDGIFFSTELSLLYDMLEDKPSLDWEYFAEYIINKNQALPTTPFKKIEELLPGVGLSVNINGATEHKQLWNISLLKGRPIHNLHEFEEELLLELKRCTNAWGESSTGICVELSGGIDSSSLVLLLRDTLANDKKLIAVNYIDSKTESSNEVLYAQEISKVCKVPLFFIDWQDSSLLSHLPSSWRPNKPHSFLLYYSTNQQLTQVAMSQGCNEIMNGQGGDHVFLAPPPQNVLSDLWLTQKLKNLFKTTHQLTQIYRMPWWQLVQENMKALLSYYGATGKAFIQPSAAYLDPSITQKLKTHDFYLAEQLKSFYPAKAMQIEGLYHGSAYAESNQRSPYSTHSHPFLSQPLVELALQIPTYQSFDDCYDRIFLRRSVSRIKDTKALWRRTKGGTTGSMVKACADHAHQIGNILLEGEFVKNGVFNKKWLDAELVKVRHGQSHHLWPLLRMLVSQLWLNQWHC